MASWSTRKRQQRTWGHISSNPQFWMRNDKILWQQDQAEGVSGHHCPLFYTFCTCVRFFFFFSRDIWWNVLDVMPVLASIAQHLGNNSSRVVVGSMFYPSLGLEISLERNNSPVEVHYTFCHVMGHLLQRKLSIYLYLITSVQDKFII